MNHPHRIDRYESMIFNNETTLKTDFTDGDIKPIIKTVYKEKPGCLKIRPPPLKDPQSLTNWKVPNVPFTLFIQPREIVQTNPRKIQEPSFKLEDLERENIRKTRPRIIMAPFASMDDFQSPEDQRRLIDDFYTTSVMWSTRNVDKVTSDRPPLSTSLPSPPNPICLPKLNDRYVSPEWRMDTVSWENKQMRTYNDTTKEFWLRRPISKCIPCKETATVNAHRKKTCQMKSGSGRQTRKVAAPMRWVVANKSSPP